MIKLLKEPLLHFLVLGALLFLLFAIVGDSPEEETELEAVGNERVISKEIVVTSDRVKNLVARFKNTWGRLPTNQERQGLIEGYIRDEVMYRQALSMNLDQDDPSVRKRMREKLEFLTNDITNLAPPSEEALQTYLEKNASKYSLGDNFTFRQVFFDKKQHGTNLSAVIAEARAKLPKAPGESDLRDFGDRTMLTRTMVGATYAEVTNRFGSQFADRLQDMPIGSWQGPVESGFGTHLVFLSERSGGETPPLETVREEVKNDWISDMRIRSNKAVYESWKSNYSITVESQTAE